MGRHLPVYSETFNRVKQFLTLPSNSNKHFNNRLQVKRQGKCTGEDTWSMKVLSWQNKLKEKHLQSL